MIQTRTDPVTVVQGDDGPSLSIQVLEGPSGDAFDMTDRGAFATLVDRQDPDVTLESIALTVADASTGSLTLSWLRPDSSSFESYLDDLDPDNRYELQVFTYRTDAVAGAITVTAGVPFFSGEYLSTGFTQDGALIFKHETEELYLSRSQPYDVGGGFPAVWLITSLRAATWDEVESQNKASMAPLDLEVVPVWNYRLPLDYVPDASEIAPPDDAFTSDTAGILTPDALYDDDYVNTDLLDSMEVSGGYVSDLDLVAGTIPKGMWREGSVATVFWDGTFWVFEDAIAPEDWIHLTATSQYPPKTGWPVGSSGSAAIAVAYESEYIDDDGALNGVFQSLSSVSSGASAVDSAHAGTQTVLTKIPLRVVPSYRLN